MDKLINAPKSIYDGLINVPKTIYNAPKSIYNGLNNTKLFKPVTYTELRNKYMNELIDTPQQSILELYTNKIKNIINNPESRLRNKYIFYLVLFIIVISLFYINGLNAKMASHPIISLLVVGILSIIFLLYIYTFDNIHFNKIAIMTMFGFVLLFLLINNPFNLFPQMEGVIIVFVIIIIVTLIGDIIKNNKKLNEYDDFDKPWFQIIYTIMSLVVSGIVILFIYGGIFGGFSKDSEFKPSYIINILVIFGMLSIVYQYLKESGLLERPFIKLLINTILYLPCLFTDIIDQVVMEYYKTNYSIVILILIEIVFILLYLAYPFIATWLFTSSKGTLLINEPIILNKYKQISDFNTLNGEGITTQNIKDYSTIQAGTQVEVLQQMDSTYYPVIITNINANKKLFDVVYSDNTFEYNVLLKNIILSDQVKQLKVGDSTSCLKNWLVGKIIDINQVNEGFIGEQDDQIAPGDSEEDRKKKKEEKEEKEKGKQIGVQNIEKGKQIGVQNVKHNTNNIAHKIKKFVKQLFGIGIKNSNSNSNLNKNTFDVEYSIWKLQYENDVDMERITSPSIPGNRIRLLNKMYPTNTKYRFGISFWIFINSTGATTKENTEYSSLLNYSNNPNVLYNSNTNELIMTVFNNDVRTVPNSSTDTVQYPNNINEDPSKYKIVYSDKNVLLQKWNNFVINYDSGTLDIFYNGELVKSSINIVPNMVYHELTVGSDNGSNAGMCNLTYFKEPLDIITINNLYEINKIKETPQIPNKLSLFTFNI